MYICCGVFPIFCLKDLAGYEEMSWKKSETRGPLILIAMKRTFLFLLTATLLVAGLCSCGKETPLPYVVDNNSTDGDGTVTTSVTWVDLGLPSGLLWADRNVGAVRPEGSGNYYAWGETNPKMNFEFDTYKYGGRNGEMNKYCNDPEYGIDGYTDNLTTLEASDDAATVNIGGGARTPTKDEWQELMDNTTSTWITRNGVNGRLLTAPNGKSIFLPTPGYRLGRDIYFDGKYSFYWSSSLDTEHPDSAWSFGFSSAIQNLCGDYGRYYGFSVRAVRAK